MLKGLLKRRFLLHSPLAAPFHVARMLDTEEFCLASGLPLAFSQHLRADIVLVSSSAGLAACLLPKLIVP